MRSGCWTIQNRPATGRSSPVPDPLAARPPCSPVRAGLACGPRARAAAIAWPRGPAAGRRVRSRACDPVRFVPARQCAPAAVGIGRSVPPRQPPCFAIHSHSPDSAIQSNRTGGSGFTNDPGRGSRDGSANRSSCAIRPGHASRSRRASRSVRANRSCCASETGPGHPVRVCQQTWPRQPRRLSHPFELRHPVPPSHPDPLRQPGGPGPTGPIMPFASAAAVAPVLPTGPAAPNGPAAPAGPVVPAGRAGANRSGCACRVAGRRGSRLPPCPCRAVECMGVSAMTPEFWPGSASIVRNP